MTFSRHYLAQRATLDAVDLAEVQGCRRAHNQLGFAYQVGFVRVAPRIVRIYTLRGFESPRLDHRALGQDRTVLRGVRERPDHRICRTQASGRPWAEESLLPSDPRARPRLQDRVHPRLPEPAGASHADPTRAPLKGEQLHALARCVHYGRLGRLDQRDFERQTGAASCLLLILAATIYWQIREIDRVLSEAGSDGRTISTSSYCPISARSGGTTSSSTASTSSTAVSCEAKGLAYKFARFWALPWWSLRQEEGRQDRCGVGCRGRGRRRRSCCDRDQFRDPLKI